MISESELQTSFPVMKVTQPIGSFYIGKMKADDLIKISWFDIRQLAGDSDLDKYLGIQRKVSDKRVKEIAQYVRLSDATFPTAVILAVEGRCASLESLNGEEDDRSDFFSMTLRNIPGGFNDDDTVLFRGIARVLDGQHRIKGLRESGADLSNFEVNVCVFVDADIADQASIFATVNLAQTKVNRSLVYDLLSYSKSRSPERTCHTVTVTLDQSERSPFYRKIKRLGVSTKGRFGEVLTQATVVQSLLPYITDNAIRDRDIGKRSGKWQKSELYNRDKLIFRHWFLEENDDQIALQLMHYFEAVRRRWPIAWDTIEVGNMLPRTNGFKAFMDFLRPAYNHLKDDDFVRMQDFSKLFEKVDLTDADFNTERFVPGTSGQRSLFKTLMQHSNLSGFD
jgi:DGQHR domain-containing protein